jgi:NAD(P)-dependent dehydrogenase (short-subunit alcohol dehydrogenase family)
VIFVSSGAATSFTATWGPYGSSKAAINHLTGTLANEEPKITTVAIRPGTVDTEMQAEIRRSEGVMDKKDYERFSKLHTEKQLLKPEQPGNVISRLALGADRALSGKFLT